MEVIIQDTPEYRQALTLHQSIVANIELAAGALIQLCHSLKEMRDQRQYTHLGYDNFEDYTELAVGMKQRQAYNYIAVLEKLPTTVLQSTANLGITKLELLTRVPALERDAFIEENDLEEMSVRELQEKLAEMTQRCEQLTLDSETTAPQHLADQYGEAVAKNTQLVTELEEAKARIEALESQPVEVAVQEPDAAAIDKIKKEAAQAAEEKAKRAVRKAREQAVQETEARMTANLGTLKEEAAAAQARAAEMERQLKLAADGDTFSFSHYFEDMQAAFHKITGLIIKLRNSDPDKAAKFSAALAKALEQLREQVEG